MEQTNVRIALYGKNLQTSFFVLILTQCFHSFNTTIYLVMAKTFHEKCCYHYYSS